MRSATTWSIEERDRGLSQIRIHHFPTGEAHTIEFPEPVYTASLGPNAEFDTQRCALPLHVAGDARLRVRLRHADAPAGAQEATGSAGRIRSGSISIRARVRQGAGRHGSAHLDRVQKGLPARRRRAHAALRLRLLRHQHGSDVQLGPAQPARSRHGLRHRAHSRRRRSRQAVARRRPLAGQEEHLHRFHRVRGALDRGKIHLSRSPRDPGRQRRRPADGRGAQSSAGFVRAWSSRMCRSSMR